jgi:hypothetical protein
MEDFYRGAEDKTMAPAARGSGKMDAVNDAAGAGLILAEQSQWNCRSDFNHVRRVPPVRLVTSHGAGGRVTRQDGVRLTRSP